MLKTNLAGHAEGTEVVSRLDDVVGSAQYRHCQLYSSGFAVCKSEARLTESSAAP